MDSFQNGVKGWMVLCFPPEVSEDKVERCDRFYEEATELTQACGYSRDRAHAIVDYVFDRAAGEPEQEVGGTMVTLAGLCNTFGFNLGLASLRELDRIMQPETMAKIRAKQAAKPTGSALPIAVPESASPEVEETLFALRQAEYALAAAYGEPLGPSLDFTRGAEVLKVLRALSASIVRAPAYVAPARSDGEDTFRSFIVDNFGEFPVSFVPVSLPDALKILDTWTDETLPAEADGRISFGRALLDVAADAIRQDLASTRPEVRAFSLLMERELRANDHKGGWSDEKVGKLMSDLFRQVSHLSTAAHELLGCGGRQVEHHRAAVIENAADVGNFAMMVADVVGGLRPAPVEGGAA